MSEKEFQEAAKTEQTNLLKEMYHLLRQNKKWWMAPILFILFLFGLLILLGGSAAAPFIYSLF